MSTAALEHGPAVPARPLGRAVGDGAGAGAAPALRAPGFGGGVRLTRRGRLVVTLVVLVSLVAAVVAGAASVSAGTASTAGADAGPSVDVVVVQPGQTLWGLAREVAPRGDTREVVRQIRVLNGLDGAGVVPGQALTVPVG